MPWARHDAGHTLPFDDQVAWLATKSSKSTVTELMRVAWRTVGSIIDRVWADAEKIQDRFNGLRRIGIDEISYKKGHKYLIVVVNHTPSSSCGQRRDAARTRCGSSSTSSAPTGASRSRMFPPTGRTASPMSSRRRARPRFVAPIRSTSCSGRPRRSTTYGASRGTRPENSRGRNRPGRVADPQPTRQSGHNPTALKG